MEERKVILALLKNVMSFFCRLGFLVFMWFCITLLIHYLSKLFLFTRKRSLFYSFYYLSKQKAYFSVGLSDDPYGTRTRVTAVKGRCLNRLTNGPI